MTFEDDASVSKPNQSLISNEVTWPKEVLTDISHAMRRDGFYQTAELIDDALLTLDIEIRRKRVQSHDLTCDGSQTALRIVK